MNTFLMHLRSLVADPTRRRAIYLVVLFLFGLSDYVLGWRTARSFEFISRRDGKPVVERRFLPRTFSREDAVSRYVSEYLLGPTDVAAAALFDKEAALRSVLLRDGVAHVDLTPESAFPVETAGGVLNAGSILASGIERNFPSIKHVVVYIEGHELFAGSQKELLPADSASKKGKSVDK